MHNIHNIMEIVQLNANAKLSEHFTLGEFTRSGSHPEVYNIPSHEAIGNLKRLCTWLEELRRRYNDRYVVVKGDSSTSCVPSVASEQSSSALGMTNGGGALGMTSSSLSSRPSEARGEISEEPIRLNSGYRSPQLNRAIGGAPNSNHLTGCAADIRVDNMEQLLRYAVILLDYADESKLDFDELLIEKNRYGAIWLHFAVRPKDRSATQGDACQSKNRRKVAFINA